MDKKLELNFTKESIHFYLKELELRDSSRSVFGSNSHDYQLLPPLDIQVISDFESKKNIVLPLDYKYFISEIGNGGAGPKYGLFPFHMHHSGHDLVDWKEDFDVGDLAKHFPHKDAWNLPALFWEQEPDPSPDISDEEEDEMNEIWQQKLIENYWRTDLINGSIPICDLGCASLHLLVITGERKGSVWADERADCKGIIPLKDKNDEPLTFSSWYLKWLRNSLKRFGIIEAN